MSPIRELIDATVWQRTLEISPSPLALNLLFEGKIAGLCIPGFLTDEECLALKARAEDLEFKDYLKVEPKIGRIGVTVFEYNAVGKSDYFEASKRAVQSVSQITKCICHPLERVIEWLGALSPGRQVNIAHEEGHGFYFAGLLRRIESGTLIHIDFAPSEQPSWAVAKVTRQLAFNVYLDVPKEEPGVVRIWEKQWTDQDDRFKIPNSYGYREDVIEAVPFAEIVPTRGMLMLINTQHFHQVSPASGVRLTVSAAIGRLPDNNIILWS